MASSSASDSPGRWQRLEALFYEALELKPEARAEFLDKKCNGDTELRKEVETLLDSAEKPLDFLEKPVLEAASRMVGDPPPANIGPGAAWLITKLFPCSVQAGWVRSILLRTCSSGARSQSRCSRRS